MPTKLELAARDDAKIALRELLKPGDTVQTILRHVSRSGMTRAISPVIDGSDYSWLVARALGDKVNQTHGGVIVGGCGMDMGFALIYELAYALWPNGFDCVGGEGSDRQDCPANDHVNGLREYGPRIHHSDGGYALRHRWL